VNRAREITATLPKWMQDRCHFEVQDYLNIKGEHLSVHAA
jgi:hypothetical protein